MKDFITPESHGNPRKTDERQVASATSDKRLRSCQKLTQELVAAKMMGVRKSASRNRFLSMSQRLVGYSSSRSVDVALCYARHQQDNQTWVSVPP